MDSNKKDLLKHFAKHLTQRLGLSFPGRRLPDLERGLMRAAAELGFANLETLVFDFTTKPITPERLQSLARHLTVGETYFFRDEAVFHTLEKEILPELIRARHATAQRLRLWSAGCCTGEEAYSLAMTIRNTLPAWREWEIEILATDVNAEFLKKATAGEYSNWSFRTTSPHIRDRYFSKTHADTSKLSANVQQMVSFKYLNLAGEDYPSVHTGLSNFDVIFCRNVLMYFSAAQATAALRRLSACLGPGGWLILGPGELNIRPGKDLVEIPSGGLRIYQKAPPCQPPPPVQQTKPTHKSLVHHSPDAIAQPIPRHATPTIPSAGPAAVPTRPSISTKQVQELFRAAKTQANRGELASAIASCDQAIALDKTNPTAHYLRGILLHETGDHTEAERALKRTIYLDPEFIVAHFALGNLERTRGRASMATRHLENARAIASRRPANEELPESDGLTTGRILQIIEAILLPKP